MALSSQALLLALDECTRWKSFFSPPGTVGRGEEGIAPKGERGRGEEQEAGGEEEPALGLLFWGKGFPSMFFVSLSFLALLVLAPKAP